MRTPVYSLKLKMHRRSQYARQKIQFNGPSDILPLLRAEMCGGVQEHLGVVLLDTSRRAIGYVPIAHGSLTNVCGSVREIFAAAILHHAHGIIVAHSHPYADAQPSDADRDLHKTLVEASRIMAVTLWDDLIVTRHRHYSFAEAEARVARRLEKKRRDLASAKAQRRIAQKTATPRDEVLAAANTLIGAPGMTRHEQVAAVLQVVEDMTVVAGTTRRILRTTRQRAKVVLALAKEMLPFYQAGQFFQPSRIEQVLALDVEEVNLPRKDPVTDFIPLPDQFLDLVQATAAHAGDKNERERCETFKS